MFRHAASYLALSILFGANNVGVATENHAINHDESLIKNLPSTVQKKNPWRPRALRHMSPYWTQVGQTIKGAQSNAGFGYAVDISDDGATLLGTEVGFDDGNTRNVGRTQVYHRRLSKKNNKPLWVKMGSPIIGDEYFALFGGAAKISGDGHILAIGSDETNDDTGHIQVYSWAKHQKEWEPMGGHIEGEFARDEFGWYFDLSEDGKTIVAGSVGHDKTGYNNGKTEIFHFQDGGWVLKGNPILGGDDEDQEAHYGWSVAIDTEGDRVLTSGLFDGKGHDGTVKVYDYDTSTDHWVQVGSTLHADGVDDEYYDEFGQSVAMSKDGSTIAIGAGCYYYCGSEHKDYVHIYHWSNSLADWDLIGNFTSSDDEHIGFGISVSLSADGERIGFITGSEKGYGYAKVFDYHGSKNWTSVGQDLIIDGFDIEVGKWGHILALSEDGTDLVVGAPWASSVKAYELADDETTSPVAGCVDAHKKVRFRWPTGSTPQFKNCRFVRKAQGQRCKNTAVASMCPRTCGKCFDFACEDGRLAWRRRGNENTCEWVAGAPKKRCSPINASVCRKTCKNQMYETLCQNKDE